MAIVSFLFLVLFLFLLHKNSLLLAENISSYFILLFLGLVAVTIPSGYLLSVFEVINSPFIWGIVICAIAGTAYFFLQTFYRGKLTSFGTLFKDSFERLKALWKESSFVQKSIWFLLFFGLLLCSGINLFVLLTTYPNEWDSMTGHLVKCAYYLQNGNMDRVHGTTWSIDFYPNSLPTLQILGFHFFGEKGFKIIHFLSYWAFVLTSYGIAKEAFSSKKGALFVAFIAALLPSALIQAVTTETDIVQSAYLGMVVYFLLKMYRNPSWQNCILIALASSIWVSHKVTFLLIGPAVALLVAFILWKVQGVRKKTIPTVLFLFLGLMIYVVPNGYLANVKEVGKFSLGALSAPEEVMKWHGIEHYSTGEKLKNFEFNVLRYSSDFLQLDGLRNTDLGSKINDTFRYFPNKVFDRFGLERNMFWVVNPFKTMGNPRFHYHKERPYWGIISFMMVFPVIALIVLFWRKEKEDEGLILALVFVGAGVLHFLSLCFSAPYDPIKGRYFMNMAVWFIPLLSWFFRKEIGMKYLLACSLVIVLSAVLTLTHRGLYPLMGGNSIFGMDRFSQLTITRPESTEAYRNFEKLVPEEAVVALGTQQEHEDYVYPLWGKNFKRKLIPIHPFRSAVKPIPKEAEFLFYSEGVIPYMEGDVPLNEGDILEDSPISESKFFLRRL